jgi:UDP-N-acetylglucosamine 1-carboxyvinyltransferase
VLENLPLVSDIFTMLEIIKSIGSRVEWLAPHKVRIVNDALHPGKLNQGLVRKIRSSILILAPLLARFGKVNLATPGGCIIGARPLDAHLESMRDLGAEVFYDAENDIYKITAPRGAKRKWGNEVVLNEFSVTATENILMLGMVIAHLKIKLAAAEPHIQDLGGFLKTLGAEIDGLGTHDILVRRGTSARGGEVRYRIMSDYIEAGTFMAMAAAVKSRITIKNAPLSFLVSPLRKLKEFGVEFETRGGSEILIKGDKSKLRAVKIQTLPYPGFPTDLQAPFGALATQCRGDSYIFDTLYEGRLKYLSELDKMGAKTEVMDSHRARIHGPIKLHGAKIKSLDLRAGATLVIAALAARGQSVLGEIEQIDRGYEQIEERLSNLGADIKRKL